MQNQRQYSLDIFRGDSRSRRASAACAMEARSAARSARSDLTPASVTAWEILLQNFT